MIQQLPVTSWHLRYAAIAHPVQLATASLWLVWASLAWAAEPPVRDSAPATTRVTQASQTPLRYDARDSLAPRPDDSSDARDCLAGLTWTTEAFQVEVSNAAAGRGDATISFPSPVPSGDSRNDRVTMEWFQALDEQDQPTRAPAVVVVHESGSAMPVGRLFARGLQKNRLHTFLIHLPYYGLRRTGRSRPASINLVATIRQAVADVRRARDAVAALPLVDASHIGLQGTSLGGFVSATSASIDTGYDSVFLLLAGGQLYDLIQNGQKDAAKVREELERSGLTGEQLRELVHTIEPTRICHRLDPRCTWLYSGRHDTVVPPRSSNALATAASLPATHHIQMNANHYSGIIYVPFVLKHIADRVHELHRQATPSSPLR